MAHKVHKYPRTALSIGGGTIGATADVVMSFSGELLTNVVFEAYNSQNALTRTVSFLDAQGVTAYSAPALADATNTLWAPTGGVPLDGSYTIRTKQSAAGATAGTDYLTLFTQP